MLLRFFTRALSFLTVLGGGESEWAALAAAANPLEYVERHLTTVIPQTQLASLQQVAAPANLSNPASPLFKTRAFPAAKLSRYVSGCAWKFLVLEMRAFPDLRPPHKAGVSWVEVYGEPVSAAEAAASPSALRSPPAVAPSMQRLLGSGWLKDAAAEAASAAPQGLAAFRPTGEAARMLEREPPKPRPNVPITTAAAPSLPRQTSAVPALASSASAAAASSSAAGAGAAQPLPRCPIHPSSMMLFRIDRKAGKNFWICTEKDTTGQACQNKIYAN